MTSPSSAGSEKNEWGFITGLGVEKCFNFNFCTVTFVYSVFSDAVVKWRYSQSIENCLMRIL